MAPERLIHKKWPPQQRINQTCVSGQEKIRRGDRGRGGCAGMFSTHAAPRAQTRTSRGRRGTMSSPVLTRHRSWKIRVPPRCGSGQPGRDSGMLGSFLRGLPAILVSLESRLVNTHPRTDRAALGYSCRAPQTMLPCRQQCRCCWRRRRDYRAGGRRV